MNNDNTNDTYSSITYSIQKHNNNINKKIEYKSYIKDNDKQISTYYNNNYDNNNQSENFNKLYIDTMNKYEQIGNSKNKKDWKIQEYHNNNIQKEYIDSYDKHSFNEYLLDSIQSLPELNQNILIDNK